jgi:flagellar biosynthesis chaperone FliJ
MSRELKLTVDLGTYNALHAQLVAMEQERNTWKYEAINGGNAGYLREQVSKLQQELELEEKRFNDLSDAFAKVVKERDEYRNKWLRLQTERNDRVWKEIRDGLREPATVRESYISERSKILSTKTRSKRVP